MERPVTFEKKGGKTSILHHNLREAALGEKEAGGAYQKLTSHVPRKKSQISQSLRRNTLSSLSHKKGKSHPRGRERTKG